MNKTQVDQYLSLVSTQITDITSKIRGAIPHNNYGLTLIILSYLALFSLPKVYEMNKTQVDQYLSLVSTQITDITSKIRGAIPFPAKKDKDN
ncbi:unnamed protein product [Oppiella nova]|uniref:Reticulon domain-containing protein n=1 Tax=Oppiella nova TaxID=334625 RepID=A0A7R9QKH4_9ACAR|nr:unnamed protein product [Oppiella nova]CAG2166802.1 unnamed protein product [Oppiella nova]